MAGWRDRKYVLDSDEEEETLSVEETHEDIQEAGQPRVGNSSEDGFLDIDNIPSAAEGDENRGDLPRRSSGVCKEIPARNIQSTAETPSDQPLDILEQDPGTHQCSQKVLQFIARDQDSDVDEIQLSQARPALSAQPPGQVAAVRRGLVRPRYPDDEVDELQQDLWAVSSPRLSAAQLATELQRHVETHTSFKIPPSLDRQASSSECTPSSPQPGLPSTVHVNSSSANARSKQPDTHEPLATNTSTPQESSGPALPERGAELGDENPGLTSRPNRSLRQRAPIQLHPYALESERYRQILKARGLKPIRIDQTEVEEDGGFDLPEPRNSRERESQTSSADTETSVGSSSPLRASSLPTSELAQPHTQDDEDEFPDLSTLLRSAPGAIMEGNKRRKIAHTFSKKSKRHDVAEHPHLVVLVDNSINDNLKLSDGPEGLQVDPASIPTLAASTTPGHLPSLTKVFRYPPGMAPVQKATLIQTAAPTVSSELKRPRVVEVNDDSDLEDEAGQAISDQSLETEDTATDSASERENEHQLQRVQRKIRGVLPASWLRLDLNAQNNSSTSTRAGPGGSLSPIKELPEKGIARPISSHKHQAGGRAPNMPVEIWDDSSSDRDTDVEANTDDDAIDIHATMRRRTVKPSLGDAVEVYEDNRIDFMLPPKQRLSKVHSRTKDRQSRLVDSGRIEKSKKKDTSLFRKRYDVKGRQSKISEHITRGPEAQTKHVKRRAPKLSIVDVTDTVKIRAAPDFVRLAVRTAGSRADKGKHSPSNKHFRMATREDTADVQEVLSTWKRDMISPNRIVLDRVEPASSIRTPLAACSGNERRRPTAFNLADGGSDLAKNANFHPQIEELSSLPKLDRKLQSTKLIERLFAGTLKRRKEQHALVAEHTSLSRNRKAVKGRMVSSLQTSAPSRPAMLESIRNPIALGRTSTHDDRQERVKKFLDSSRSSAFLLPRPDIHRDNGNSVEECPTQPTARRRLQNRKRPPIKVDIDTPAVRQDSPSSVDPSAIFATVEGVDYVCKNATILQSLGPFGTQYSTKFGVAAFPPGVRFHRASFVGSGDFSRSLQMLDTRDHDLPTNLSVIKIGDASFEWGPWNDTVSSQLGIAYNHITDLIRAPEMIHDDSTSNRCNPTNLRNAVSTQRSVINYITKSLFFLDPVDRCPCIQRCIGLMSTLNSDLDHANFEPARGPATASEYNLHKTRTRISMQNLTMVYQISRLASHISVPQTIKADLFALLSKVARRTLSLSLANGTGEIRKVFRCVAQVEPAEEVEGWCEAEAMVVAHHVLAHSSVPGKFWDEVNGILQRPQFEGTGNVRVLDYQWQQLMSVVPLLDFDIHGTITDRNDKPGESLDNWSLVRNLVQPVLHAYMENPRGQASTFNAYFRAVLERCFDLVHEWKWRKCESIVLAVFDFFAALNLGHLLHEAAHGSPPFLEHLTHDLELSIGREDRCFHIFLKLLGVGLTGMRNAYANKKISGIVWRMMPNHNRHHPKDEPLSQEDLDALRNHHDLLCVLYWASPSGFRPRLSVLRNLVHLENSHKEACHISIRAWSNLVNFQISTSEPVSTLEPFAEWCDDILTQVIRLHRLARSEVENQIQAVELSTSRTITRDVQESAIAKNQRQVEAILSDALISLRKAIDAASVAEHAQIIFPEASLANVLDLFDAKQPRINGVVVQALDVILALLKKISSSGGGNEDSQGYGDWSVFDEELGDLALSKNNRLIPEGVYRSLRRLLSNCFGADVPPEDDILLKVVCTWSDVAQLYVAEGAKTWDDYIGPYGQDSWDSLGDTAQTRKFTVTFFATLLAKNRDLYRNYRQLILKLWISSLAERESLLKFQHQLTAAVLNADRDNPILSNPPFWLDSRAECFIISASDLRERRSSVIYTILSNMRESMNFNNYHRLPERSTLRNEYTELIKHLMATMKHNYQELGQGSNVRGVYVDFVQQVIEYLQQHTAEICPIDKFFMDPAAFPLPGKDPTYVVGRLKSYGLRLQDSKTAKQLSVFIQAVTERAVGEGQQKYLIEQLSTALSNNVETGDHAKPSLRTFSIQAIFPAYIELVFRTSGGALLAKPILEALEEVLRNIILDMDGLNNGNVAAIQTTIFFVLKSLQESTQLLVDQPNKLEEPLNLSVLSKYFDILVAALPTIDYIARLRPTDKALIGFVAYFLEFAHHVTALLDQREDVLMFFDKDDLLTIPADEKSMSTREFTRTELRNKLQKNWICHDGRTYVTKGKTRMEVSVTVGSIEEEKGRLKECVEEFERVLECMPSLGSREEVDLHVRRVPSGLEELIY